MYRIQAKDGAIGGPKWRFSEGEPGPSGHPPTRLAAAWLNTVQEELINLVEKAGIEPSLTDETQILNAVRLITALAIDARLSHRIVVGPGGHFARLADAVTGIRERTSILVTATEEISQPIKVDAEFVAISFRWGATLTRAAAMTADHMFEVSKNGLLLEGLNAEGFKNFVKFSQPAPVFAFLRNVTLKGGAAPTTGGTPTYLDPSTIILY